MPSARMFVARPAGPSSVRTFLATTVGTVTLMFCAQARAQCTVDTECKRDRICENGSCLDPPPAAPPIALATPRFSTPSPPEAPSPARLERRSPIMMAGGIGCVVLAGVGLVVAAGAFLKEAGCGFGNVGSLGSRGCANDNDDGYIVGGLLSTAVLTSLGVPLIVIGSRKEPASPQSAATLAPWMGRQGAGLSLRFDL